MAFLNQYLQHSTLNDTLTAQKIGFLLNNLTDIKLYNLQLQERSQATWPFHIRDPSTKHDYFSMLILLSSSNSATIWNVTEICINVCLHIFDVSVNAIPEYIIMYHIHSIVLNIHSSTCTWAICCFSSAQVSDNSSLSWIASSRFVAVSCKLRHTLFVNNRIK